MLSDKLIDESNARFELLAKKLIHKDFSDDDKYKSRIGLETIHDRYGYIIDSYPTWHPLVTHHDSRLSIRWPGRESGYKGLDHTYFFVNAFITCPYTNGDEVIESVEKLNIGDRYTINAEKLDFKLYNENVTPVLVSCEWDFTDRLIKPIMEREAISLWLNKEIPSSLWSDCGECWENMRDYFIGQPNNKKSSLFLNIEICSKMEKIWNSIIKTGAYGPVKYD